MIAQLDFLVRMIAVGTGLLLIAQFMANEVRARIKLPMVGMIVGVLGYLINSTPLMTGPGALDPLIDLVSISAPFWIWLFARRLFEREPDPRVLLGSAGLLGFGWFIANFVPLSGLAGSLLLHVVALALIADLIRVGVFEREDDLVEQRRIIRLWLPLLAALHAGAILIFELFELFLGLDGRFPFAQMINSVLILMLMLFAGIALMRTDPALLIESETPSEETGEEEREPADLSPNEKVLYAKLKEAVAAGIYRQPGMSIARLAGELGAPEHRLRALINQRMGHRNFSAFLNRHRIAEARERLRDPEMVSLPVLTIAMDLGYNSLATFNRAFRSETGTSPSEYRRSAIGEAPLSGEETALQK